MPPRCTLLITVLVVAGLVGASSSVIAGCEGRREPAATAARQQPSGAGPQESQGSRDEEWPGAPGEGAEQAAGREVTAPPVRLDPGPVLSPLGPEVVDSLREIAGRVERSDDVFAKIGDSATVSRAFLECFGGDLDEVDLGEAQELAATMAFFREGNAGGRDPFRRNSLAADVGWSARQLLVGSPPPLLREVRAISPRFGFALNGGNDVEGRDVERFANRMLRLVDHLTSRGVIPILGTITPREDDAEAERWVRRYNGVVRAIAAGKRLPLIDFHQALEGLPRKGLAADGVHPNVFVSGGATRPCDLSEAGLRFGSNLRNLLALRMLDRLRRTVVEGEAAPGPAAPDLTEPGSAAEPLPVATLPFTDMRSTADSSHRDLDRYPCSPEHDESGAEYVYRLRVDRPLELRAWVFSEGGVDVDVHLLRGSATEGACVARDDAEVVHSLEPGTWFVVVDTFVEGGEPRAGDFLLVLDEGAGS